MRQKSKNYQIKGSNAQKIFIFFYFPSHIPIWVWFVQKTRAKNSHAWAPLMEKSGFLAHNCRSKAIQTENQKLPTRSEKYLLKFILSITSYSCGQSMLCAFKNRLLLFLVKYFCWLINIFLSIFYMLYVMVYSFFLIFFLHYACVYVCKCGLFFDLCTVRMGNTLYVRSIDQLNQHLYF